MSTDHHSVRIETLLALSLSKRWPRDDPDTLEVERPEGEASNENRGAPNDLSANTIEANPIGAKDIKANTGGTNIEANTVAANTIEANAMGARQEENHSELNGGLPFVLRGLSTQDRAVAEALLRRFENLSPGDQNRWLASRLGRIRASAPEKDRRFEKDIHPSQIAEALRYESPRIQSLILGLLPSSQAEPVAETLNIEVNSPPSMHQPTVSKLAGFVRRAFFAQFVSISALSNPTPLDLLTGVELARLIRLLGVRETAIACKGIAAVETVTAFLKRFSAEDAHAIVFHLAALKDLKPDRIVFAEAVARKAINEESNVASTMLDRVGLALLAIVLKTYGPLRRRHTIQKLPLAAARELEELLNGSRPYPDHETAHRIVAEAQSLADNLHRSPSDASEERRGAPVL